MWTKKEFYVITAFFKDDDYSSPSEEFLRESRSEAEALKAELEQEGIYDEIFISDEKEEREVWR